MAHAVEGISIEFLSLGIKQLKIEGFQRLQNDVIIWQLLSDVSLFKPCFVFNSVSKALFEQKLDHSY